MITNYDMSILLLLFIFYQYIFYCSRDDVEEVDRLYGLTKERFDYNKAPNRGWQEDKKDFTHRDSYIKYHESEEDQPYSVPR